MKKIFFVSLTIVLLSLLSCRKSDQEMPGNISGMGNTPGELEVKVPYVLPHGIHLIGDITGIDNSSSKAKGSDLNFDAKADFSYFGSGRFVRIKLSLLNTYNYRRTVFFHKGLLFKCRNGEYQHLMLCQTTWFCLDPNSTRNIYLDLYCVNNGSSTPDQNATFKILGITSSPVMNNFLNRIGWRKINYEMIFGTFDRGKGSAEEPTYEEITERLQDIVWNLTDNGIDLTQEDIAFIESIPELTSEEIPPVDENSQFPEYFEEFIVPGK